MFFKPKIPTEKVKFNEVVRHRQLPDELQPILNSIKENSHYQTIIAYANVSKHRYVIQGTNNIKLTEIPYVVSYRSVEFEYKGKWHQLTHDITFKCWEFADESIIQVGINIQKLMKSSGSNQLR
jgi:hypothetical protein